MSVNYEKASFAELGKMLGMSKAGIFKYYKNKQELFIAVVDKFCFSAQNPRNKFTETNGTFAEFIDEYVRGVQRTMDMLATDRCRAGKGGTIAHQESGRPYLIADAAMTRHVFLSVINGA